MTQRVRRVAAIECEGGDAIAVKMVEIHLFVLHVVHQSVTVDVHQVLRRGDTGLSLIYTSHCYEGSGS